MKQRTLRLCTLLVALVLLAIPLASCSSRGKTLLTLDKDGVKVTFLVLCKVELKHLKLPI